MIDLRMNADDWQVLTLGLAFLTQLKIFKLSSLGLLKAPSQFIVLKKSLLIRKAAWHYQPPCAIGAVLRSSTLKVIRLSMRNTMMASLVSSLRQIIKKDVHSSLSRM